MKNFYLTEGYISSHEEDATLIYNEENDILIYICANTVSNLEYLRIWLPGYNKSGKWRRIVHISLYDPVYLIKFRGVLFTKEEKEWFINYINNNWNYIKECIDKMYNREYNKYLCDIYKEFGKSKVVLPDNPPDYTLLPAVQ